MAIPTFTVYATGDTIEASWANDLRQGFLEIDSRTGGDPGASGKAVVSTSSTAGAWQTLAESDQLTAKRVKRTSPTYASFALAVAELSGFVDVNNPADAPTAATRWHLIQARMPDPANFTLQLAVDVTNQDETYVRAIVNGVAGTWRKLLHAGNMAAVALAGLTLTTSSHIAAGGNVTGAVIASSGAMSAGGNLTVGGILTSTVASGTAPLQVTSPTVVTNLNADLLDGLHASDISAGSFPSGVGAWVPTAAAIPSGFSRYTALDGRMPVGAGTTFSTTFVEATDYGSTWSHGHSDSGHGHNAAALGVSGSTGGPSSNTGVGGGAGTAADGSHTHPSGGLDVSGNTDGGSASISSVAWQIPARAVVWIRKD